MTITSTWMAIVSLSILLVISVSILISLTEGFRKHRIGATLVAGWAILALVFFVLKAFGEPLPRWLYASWIWPAGVLCGAWALWDVSRLSRLYGTSTLMSAAEIARGFLHSPLVTDAVWGSWIHGFPSAAWLKGRDGLMIAINRHYEHAYGKPSTRYAGAHDEDVWPEVVSDEFAGNDRQVFQLGAPIIVREPAPTWANPKRTSLVLKFPVRDAKGNIVGVGGVELSHPFNSEADEHEAGA